MDAALLADLAQAERRLYFDAQAMALAGRLVNLDLPPDDAYHWTIVLCVMLDTTFPHHDYTRPDPATFARSPLV